MASLKLPVALVILSLSHAHDKLYSVGAPTNSNNSFPTLPFAPSTPPLSSTALLTLLYRVFMLVDGPLHGHKASKSGVDASLSIIIVMLVTSSRDILPLYSADEVPRFLQRPHIHRYYRYDISIVSCVWSIFKLHNESVSPCTHTRVCVCDELDE